MEPVLVEVECITSTAADTDYFEKGRTYTIDMVYAKRRDIWRHFRAIREVSNEEAEQRIQDEILPGQVQTMRGMSDANEEAEAHLAERRPEATASFPNAPAKPKAKPKAKK